MVMTNVAGFGVHGIFCAPLITDVVVLFVAVEMLASEFKKMNELEGMPDLEACLWNFMNQAEIIWKQVVSFLCYTDNTSCGQEL